MTQKFSHLISYSNISILLVYLHIQGTTLDFQGAFFDDERYAVRTVSGYLSKVNPKQVQSALELFMTTLNSKSLQALLMTGQGTLCNRK